MQAIAQEGHAGGARATPDAIQPTPGGVSDAQTSTIDDFWDSTAFQNAADFTLTTSSNLAPAQLGGYGQNQKSSALWVSLLMLALLIGGGVAYAIFALDQNPFQGFTDLWSSFFTDHEAELDAEVVPPQDRSPVQEADAMSAVEAPPQPETLLKPIPGNPYWALPNAMVHGETLGPLWTPEQEEQWRAGIVHKFPYQRLKTVQIVRRTRRTGAEAIFWDAQQDKKAWTRLFAVIGLAEYNIPVANKTLSKALGPARSELIAGFLARFVEKPNAGQAYVMRQIIRLLDERGRLTCLRAIWNTHDGFRDLYLAAATLDPGPEIQAWIRNALLQKPMSLARYDDLVATVKGTRPAEAFEKLKGGPMRAHRAKAGPARSDASLNGISTVSSSVDLPDEARGDVTFFDEAPRKSQRRAGKKTAEELDYEP